MAVVTLKKGEGRTIKSGGMWIFDNEIASIMGSFEDGDIVIVHDFDGYPMGKGFINRNSKIRVRLMTRNTEQEIDDAFLRERLENAWEYRKKTVDTSSCRVVFGEADFLPGLVIDKFSDVLVVQSLALGIDRVKNLLINILKNILKNDGIIISGVYERSDAKVRLQEGMERFKGFIGDPFPTEVEITENGVRYIVDVEDGQKTGFLPERQRGKRILWHTQRKRSVYSLAGSRRTENRECSRFIRVRRLNMNPLSRWADFLIWRNPDIFTAVWQIRPTTVSHRKSVNWRAAQQRC